MSIEQFVSAIEDIKKHKETHKFLYYEPYEYQRNFHHAKSEGKLAVQRALMAANQVGKCTSFSTVINTSLGKKKMGELFGTECEVLTYPDREPRKVLGWIRKPKEECFRITMSDGQWVEVPKGHRILLPCGYDTVANIFEQLPVSVVYHPLTNSGICRLARTLDVRRYYRKLKDCLDDYLVDHRLRGGRLLSDQDNVQVFAPLPNDAQRHNFVLSRLGGLVNKCTDSLSPFFDRLSRLGAYLRTLGQSLPFLSPIASLSFRHMSENSGSVALLGGFGCRQSPSDEELIHQSLSSSLSPITVDGNHIVSVHSVGFKTLYDMEVEDRHHYIAGGLVHHNSYSAAMETTFHATGMYPDWWEGHRFTKAVNIVVAGKRNETVRDVCQNELLGDPFEESAHGTGTLPKSLIGKSTRKAGVPQALTAVMVKHVSGAWSKIRFMAFEQGPEAFMGIKFDAGWLDEEPPENVWTQFIRAVLSRDKYCLYMTFTPEEGVTKVVDGFMNNLRAGQALTRATWDDAPHMTEERKDAFLSQLPPHERKMRSQGIPLMGSGLIWPVSDDEISIEPFDIPKHWPRICGIDFGIDHPFAAVWIAFDRDTDTAYVYACYRESGARPPTHASAIKKKGDWIPIVWPHDGLERDKASGVPLADTYRSEGLKLRPDKFSNPPAPGQKEGQGGNGVEVGLFEIHNAMELGGFKVFSNLPDWFEEKNQYHRKDNKVVKLREDLMAATRYAYQSRRFAHTRPVRRVQLQVAGASNW